MHTVEAKHNGGVGGHKSNPKHVPIDIVTCGRWATAEEVAVSGGPTTAVGRRTAGWEERASGQV